MKMIKLETKEVYEREVKLEPGWKIVHETDAPSMYAPNIPEVFTHGLWTEWERVFSYIPRKSIYGKWRWGVLYRRGTLNAWGKEELYRHHPDYKEQWATKKELFRWKLSGDS